MSNAQRMDWVDIAKGISILLVVMMYSAYSVGEDTGGVGVLHYIIGFATPFRMPEFFLISGLFLSRVIGRNWLQYADRRVVHYLYFYILWMLIHIVVKAVLTASAPPEAMSLALLGLIEPYGVLWFIYLLAVFGAAAKLAHQLKVPHWVPLVLGASLQMAHVQTGSYIINQFAEYFVFFYAGYVFSPIIFSLAERAQKAPAIAFTGLLTWAAIQAGFVFLPSHVALPVGFEMGYAANPVLHLLLALAGGMAICVGAALLAKIPHTNWLRWLGEHSLVIYLAFALPMSMVREVLIGLNLISDTSLLSIIVMVSSVIAPVMLYWTIKRTGKGRFLIERPEWAKLPSVRNAQGIGTNPVNMPAE